MRARTELGIAVLLASLPGACAGGPTLDAPRRLDAPIASGARLFERFLGPTAFARDTRELLARGGSMLQHEADFASPFRTGGRLLGDEIDRLPHLAPRTAQLLGAEVGRLGDLRRSPAWSEFDPGERLGALRRGLLDLPHTLQLDRRAMGEPDDLRHRTDPDDDHPEAGFLPRILRRILP